MKEPRVAADAFRRTRRDHAEETAEDYVEAIDELQREQGKCRIVDLASRFAVSHVTVSKIVARLKKEGLVASDPYKPLELTPAGSQLAAKSRRQHEIVYQFLRAIGVPDAVAAVDAEGIEHHVSRQTLECFRRVAAQLRPGSDG